MTELTINQRHVDSAAKQFGDVLATINATLGEVSKMLSPDNQEAFSGTASVLTGSYNAAQALTKVIDMLASLIVVKRLQSGMETAMSAEDPEQRTMLAVAYGLKEALVANANGLEEALYTHGPFAHAFKANVVEQLANAITMSELMRTSHMATEKLCAEHGIDYDKVQAGDKDATAALLHVIEETAGPVNPSIYEALGIAPPERVTPDNTAAQDAAIADAMGLETGAVAG